MSDLVRFGVGMNRPLLEAFDGLVDVRGVTRSELLRDLVRAEIAKGQIVQGVPAFASLTLVYDHHVRDLSEKLTEIQHDLGDHVRSTLHVHLDHDHCMEVIILRGRSDELQRIAERLLATRGVTHGGIQIVSGVVHGDHEHGPRSKKSKPKTKGPRARPVRS